MELIQQVNGFFMLRSHLVCAHYTDLREFKSYTVLSTAPYFTAHIIWGEIGTWTGGGLLHIRRGTQTRYIHGKLPIDLKLTPDSDFELSLTIQQQYRMIRAPYAAMVQQSASE